MVVARRSYVRWADGAKSDFGTAVSNNTRLSTEGTNQGKGSASVHLLRWGGTLPDASRNIFQF